MRQPAGGGARGWGLLVGLVLAALLAVRPVQGAEDTPDAYVIKIDRVITQALSKAVQRKIEFAEKRGVRTVIIELNTPGGEVMATRELADFIFSKDDMNIVAYVNTDAISGGTFVALACKAVYIDKRLGFMGNVAPVDSSVKIQGEKYQTLIRESMLRYARARGYPVALVRAMVTPRVEVWRLQMQDEPEGTYRYIESTQLDAMSDEEAARIVRKDLVVAREELLSMDTAKAVEFGFARKAVANAGELYAELGVDPKKVQTLYLTPSEKILSVLDMFAPLFIVAGIVLMFIELNNPGFGLPGLLGLTCFAGFFLVKFSLHYAHMLELLLFAAGLALLMVEVLVIPGFGLAGISGILLLFVSLVLASQQFTLPASPGQAMTFQLNVVMVLGSFAVAAIAVVILAHFLPSIPLLGRMVNRHSLAAAQVGEISWSHTPILADLTGRVGIALTPLHPSGRAEFDETPIDVVTEGEFVPKGARVKVLSVVGARVVVEPYQEA